MSEAQTFKNGLHSVSKAQVEITVGQLLANHQQLKETAIVHLLRFWADSGLLSMHHHTAIESVFPP